MDIRLLGPVELSDGANLPVRLERARQRGILAALALQPGRLVGTDALIGQLWDENPPEKARETLATYTRQVRAALLAAGAGPGVLTNHRRSGYALHVPPDQVDYHRFAALVRDAAREPAPAESALLYARAVGLWRGDPLADVGTDWAKRTAIRLRQEHTDASCALFRRQMLNREFATAAAGVSALLSTVVPTDEMITIGVEALAYAGRHSDIDQFLAEASSRMWRLAEARPGAAVRALAARLRADPPAAPRPAPEPLGREDEAAGGARLTAINCGTVFMAAGDQIVSMRRHH